MNCNVKPVIWECPCHLHKFVDFCTVTWNEFTNENDISPQEAKKEANIKLIKSTFNKENNQVLYSGISSLVSEIFMKSLCIIKIRKRQVINRLGWFPLSYNFHVHMHGNLTCVNN